MSGVVKKGLILFISVLFIGSSILPSISGDKHQINNEIPSSNKKLIENYFEKLENSNDIYDTELKTLEQKIYNLIPGNKILSKIFKNKLSSPINALNSDLETFSLCMVMCNGEGMTYPYVFLPRPRLYTSWNGTGVSRFKNSEDPNDIFYATGEQSGEILGFFGIGYTDPYEYKYSFVGYALMGSVTAERIADTQTNWAPTIIDVNPSHNSKNVPLDLSELSFELIDSNGDKMDYTVTTYPDIGSGSGNNVGDGFYNISVSGLQPNTIYQWNITATDTYNSTGKRFYKFTTASETV